LRRADNKRSEDAWQNEPSEHGRRFGGFCLNKQDERFHAAV
jgi:hypothetical protein